LVFPIVVGVTYIYAQERFSARVIRMSVQRAEGEQFTTAASLLDIQQ